MNLSTHCQDDRRRDAVRARPGLNGLDYLEVSEDQRTLTVYFLGKAPPYLLRQQGESVAAYKARLRQHVRIEGGQRVRDIQIVDVTVSQARDPRTRRINPELDDWMVVQVDKYGDFTPYTLRLMDVENIDPFYDHLQFTFKAGCPTALDCLPTDTCPPPVLNEPEINYLAKDYASFRQLILDRLALIMPQWRERHVPDIGIALVEVLAYVGDHLSYYQDAVATEAYLETARQRISVRRHARLVDYRVHEGCNARAWVCIDTDTALLGSQALDPAKLCFITGLNETLSLRSAILSADDLHDVPASQYEVFEPVTLQPIQLYAAHSRICFYTWGNRECCLPRGATSATLRESCQPTPPGPDDQSVDQSARGQHAHQHSTKQTGQAPAPASEALGRQLHLQPGDVLVFEEVVGPKTGVDADANPSHRHAVRLTEVAPGQDPLDGTAIVEIEWAEEDALPFPLCISAMSDAEHGCQIREDISVARGNVVLVDHGCTQPPEDLGLVPCLTTQVECVCQGRSTDISFVPGRYRPVLAQGPLTHRVPLPQPRVVAQQQARLLAKVLPRVRARIAALARQLQVRDAQPLANGELAELRTIAGAWPMGEAARRAAEGRDWPSMTAVEQMKAMEQLMAHQNHWLADKERRVARLQRRATGGHLLADAASEVTELLGAPYADGLAPDSRYVLGSASQALSQDPREALPQIELTSIPPAPASKCAELIPLLDLQQVEGQGLQQIWRIWSPRSDLLDSGPGDPHFVAEVENDGRARLRFGNGQLGRPPEAGSLFHATYRVGNGTAGNVGAEAISHMVLRDATLNGVSLHIRNPLPATGGVDAEPMAEVKLFAPNAFRKQLQRAITADDYAQLVERNFPQVQRAAGALAWNGSWYEAQVSVDARSTVPADVALLDEIEHHLYRYRRIGHDLAVQPAHYVPLDIEMVICVLPHYLRGHVEAELRDLFSSRITPRGGRGLFHPDNLTFGAGIYLSKLVAAAQAIKGVDSVKVTKLHRLYEGARAELAEGVLRLGPSEVAQLDNDPSFPEHGRLVLEMRGGR